MPGIGSSPGNGSFKAPTDCSLVRGEVQVPLSASQEARCLLQFEAGKKESRPLSKVFSDIRQVISSHLRSRSHTFTTDIPKVGLVTMPTCVSNTFSNQSKVKAMIRTCSVLINMIAVTVALSLTACGGGGGSGSDGTGTLSLSLTDAPVQNEDIAEVIVCFTNVIIHPSNGNPDIVEDVRNQDGSCREIDLKKLTNGNSVVLGEFDIPAGDYSWIRLDIDPDNTVIVEREVVGNPDEVDASEPDTIYPPALLDCSSCDQSHLKLNSSFSIADTGFTAFTIDFDLQKSLTLQLPQSIKPRPDDAYKLRPTLRILDTALASTFIWGSVTDVTPLGSANLADCRVYTYTGDAATVIPDDICNAGCIDGLTPEDRPLDIALVEADVINNDGTFDYRTGSLYPGTYTLALFCEADDPDFDEQLNYIGERDVTTGGASPSGHGPVDFDLADTPGGPTP